MPCAQGCSAASEARAASAQLAPPQRRQPQLEAFDHLAPQPTRCQATPSWFALPCLAQDQELLLTGPRSAVAVVAMIHPRLDRTRRGVAMKAASLRTTQRRAALWRHYHPHSLRCQSARCLPRSHPRLLLRALQQPSFWPCPCHPYLCEPCCDQCHLHDAMRALHLDDLRQALRRGGSPCLLTPSPYLWAKPLAWAGLEFHSFASPRLARTRC